VVLVLGPFMDMTVEFSALQIWQANPAECN
jgi:hypothetical protein